VPHLQDDGAGKKFGLDDLHAARRLQDGLIRKRLMPGAKRQPRAVGIIQAGTGLPAPAALGIWLDGKLLPANDFARLGENKLSGCGAGNGVCGRSLGGKPQAAKTGQDEEINCAAIPRKMRFSFHELWPGYAKYKYMRRLHGRN